MHNCLFTHNCLIEVKLFVNHSKPPFLKFLLIFMCAPCMSKTARLQKLVEKIQNYKFNFNKTMQEVKEFPEGENPLPTD